MFAASKTGAPVTAKDPQFKYVTMLLHGDGTNGAQNNTFLDSSTNNFTITRNGNTTQGTYSPYGSNWSNYFNGSSTYLSIANATPLQLNANQFTIEGWFFFTTSGVDNYIISQTSGSADANVNWFVRVTTTNQLRFLVMTSGASAVFFDGSTTITSNTWHHFAATCDGTGAGSNMRSWVDGVYQGGTTVNSANINTNAGQTQVGAWSYNANYSTGYISNVRVLKGTALYTGTSNITVPTAPLTAITNTSLLTSQSNRFIDNSSNAYTVTANGSPSVQRFSPFSPTSAYSTSVIGGSGYFDGSGDYLRVAYNSNLYPATTLVDYTVECWVYPTAGTGGLQFILGTNNTTVADWTFTQDAGQWGFTLSGTGGNAGTVIANQWTHLAMTRNGLTVNGYVNGVRVLTTTASTQSNNGLPLNIGMRNGSDRAFTGYITDVRVVNGTAVYTGTSYTVPTAPLTAITNTQFLSNNTNAGILDNAMMNDLETVGNAQISTSVKKYGTGSMYFDGTGDALLALSNPQGDFGSGNFTLEGWFYQTATTNQGYFSKRANTSSYSPFLVQYDSSQLSAYLSTSGSSWAVAINASTNPSTNTWNHVALVRNGSTATLYLNGTSVGSASISGSLMTNSTPVVIGAQASDANNCFNGYIDDVRITKGYARYTANFTAPTAPFPDKG